MKPAEMLKRLMASKGLNPNSLAAATNNATKQPQIYRFLNNEVAEPKRSTWEPVAKYFKISVDAFFDEKEADRALAEFESRMAGESSGAAVESACVSEDDESQAESNLELSVQLICKAIAGSRITSRAQLKSLFSVLADHPEEVDDVAGRVSALLIGEKSGKGRAGKTEVQPATSHG